MADLLIRDIDPELKRMIQARAKAHDRSLSEETQALVKKALTLGVEKPLTGGMGTFLGSLIAPEEWTDDFIVTRETGSREPPDFS
ncbi:MAG: FitA-like ribbon-helix-helix domain-containing protein [Bosea sp. (in: a-proteobacteria)]